ncbi:hypothetical protein HPCPY1313_0189 [Helicobacter pylori CPY1313]|nr:hypothetical protein HPCPY1313_0189 [Helicobacter pylori CPY1313]
MQYFFITNASKNKAKFFTTCYHFIGVLNESVLILQSKS